MINPTQGTHLEPEFRYKQPLAFCYTCRWGVVATKPDAVGPTNLDKLTGAVGGGVVSSKTVDSDPARSSSLTGAELGAYVTLIYKDLQAHDFDAFMDVRNLDSGEFNPVILRRIDPRALRGCTGPRVARPDRRRRGADHLRRGASSTQRHFCGNRQADAHSAA